MELKKNDVAFDITKRLFYIIISFVMMPIAYFTIGRDVTFVTIRNILAIFSLIFCVFMQIKDKELYILEDTFILIIIYEYITTAINFGLFNIFEFSAFNNDFIFFSLACLFSYIIKKDSTVYFQCSSIYFEVLIYLNLLWVLSGRVPATGYMVTNRCLYPPVFIVALMSCYIRSYKKNDTYDLRYVLFYIVCAVLAYLSDSSTSIIIITLMLTIFVMPFLTKHSKIFNIFSYYVVGILFYLLFVFGRCQKYFSIVIEKLLHKSLSFSGRTDIWDAYIKKIMDSPIIGYGNSTKTEMYVYVKEFEHSYLYGPHNALLELLNAGGILLAGMFILIYCYIGKQLLKNKENLLAATISIYVLVTIIGGLTGRFYASFWCLIIISAANIKYIIDKENCKSLIERLCEKVF